jgi:hypothetical protein
LFWEVIKNSPRVKDFDQKQKKRGLPASFQLVRSAIVKIFINGGFDESIVILFATFDAFGSLGSRKIHNIIAFAHRTPACFAGESKFCFHNPGIILVTCHTVASFSTLKNVSSRPPNKWKPIV